MRKSSWAGVVGSAVLVLAAGCGGSDGEESGGAGGDAVEESGFADLPTDQIVTAAKDAMAGLESVRLRGDIVDGDDRVEIDIHLTTDQECDGWIRFGGAQVDVRRVGGEAWMRPDEEFWQTQAGDQGDMIVTLVGDRWVVDDSGSFDEFCDLEGFLAELTDSDDDEGTYTNEGVSDVGGVEVVAIRSGDPDDPATAYISTAEPHYVLKMEPDDETGEITFSEFDEAPTIEAPAPDDQVDLSDLG